MRTISKRTNQGDGHHGPGRSVVPRSRPESVSTYLCVNKSQTYAAFQATATTGYVFSPSSSSMSFEVSQSPDFSSFASIYDQYRVKCVDVHLTWLNGQNISSSTQGSLLVVSDPDGGSVPGNYEQFTLYRRLWRFGLPVLDGLTRSIKGLPSSTTGTLGQVISTGWMDCADASLATYRCGYTAMLKRASSPSGIQDTLMVQYRVQVEFRYRR